MSLIKSFNGIRPKAKFAKKVSTPNLSYLNYIKKNKKLNFLNILTSKNISDAQKILQKLKEKKIIFQDNLDSFYLYKITYGKKILLGIIGKINLNNYDDKKILGHEETFPDRVKQRKQQLLRFNSQVSPIYTTYKTNSKNIHFLKKLFNTRANYTLQAKDKCTHKMWVINKPKKKLLVMRYLKKIKKIYICDGHHRIQAMLRSKRKIAPMIIAFPSQQVNILDYNRVINSRFNLKQIKRMISKNFIINKSNRNKSLKTGQFRMYSNKSWYLLNPLKKFKDLDVNVIKKYIFNKILKNKKNIKYVSGFKNEKNLEKLVDSKKYNLAFKMCPTNISEVINFAEKRRFMPPKSTWFHPKPLDGLILSKIIS